MTVREALDQAARLFDEGEASELETARTLEEIFAHCPESIPPNECEVIKKIIADAVMGEVDAYDSLRLVSAVMKCNKLLDRSLLSV
jgi:hypothetical protein